MATTVARLEAVLSADTRNFDRGMDRSEGKMRGATRAAGAAGIAIGGALVVGSIRAVRAASDLNEEIDKSKVVFGRASTEVLKWSGGTASSLGMSRRMALQAAGAYGNMFKTIGLGDKPAADMSRRMVTLAADMASFSNVDPSEMLQNLQSGLAGQAEPLRKYGVLLSEARVKTEAYKMGIATVGSVLTEQQKVQARYSLIMKDSALQQGNFADTAGSLANQQRIAKAQVEDLSAKLGMALMPAIQKVLSVLTKLVGWLSEHTNVAKALAIGLGILATALLAAAAAQLLLNLAFLANPIGLVVLAIAALVAGFVIAYKESETFRDVVSAAMDAVMVVISGLVWYFEHTWKPIITTALNAVKLIFGWFRDNSNSIWSGVKNAVTTMATPVKDAFNNVKTAINAVQDFFIWFRDSGGGFWDGLKGTINTAINAVRDAFDGARDKVNKVQDLFIWFRDAGGSAIQAMWNAAKVPLEHLADGFKAVWGWLKKVKDAINWLIENVSKIKMPKLDLPDVNPFGDPRSPRMTGPPGGGTGPTDISSKLWDELSGARRFGLTLTSGYRPGAITRSGTPSDHGMYPSHAIDVAGSSSAMAGFFRWLIGQRDVKQAFYDPLGSIFGGMLSSYREGGHSDHVHVATYDKGGWLKPGLTLAANNTGRPERVGGGTILAPIYIGGQHVVDVVFDLVRGKAQVYERRNSRPAFGR